MPENNFKTEFRIYKEMNISNCGKKAIIVFQFCYVVDEDTEFDPKTNDPIDGFDYCLKIITISDDHTTEIEIWHVDYDHFTKSFLDQMIKS